MQMMTAEQAGVWKQLFGCRRPACRTDWIRKTQSKSKRRKQTFLSTAPVPVHCYTVKR